MKNLLYLLLASCFLFSACGDDQDLVDDELITAFLTENNIDATKTESGLYYVITEEGAGDSPTTLNTVTVRYTGTFLDGVVFDGTTANPIQFPLSNVIQGWREGIPLLRTGGSGTFYIPSGLAYGSAGRGSIPPNTVLVFDVELISFF